MNQKQMQYFVTVYETQNIQAAADQLFVTRQGVSKVIRLLETELGRYFSPVAAKVLRQQIMQLHFCLMPDNF